MKKLIDGGRREITQRVEFSGKQFKILFHAFIPFVLHDGRIILGGRTLKEEVTVIPELRNEIAPCFQYLTNFDYVTSFRRNIFLLQNMNEQQSESLCTHVLHVFVIKPGRFFDIELCSCFMNVFDTEIVYQFEE